MVPSDYDEDRSWRALQNLARNPRLSIALPDGIMAALERWAEAEGNRPTSLATFLLEKSIREAVEEGKIPPLQSNRTNTFAYKSISQLVMSNWDKLIEYDRVSAERLRLIRDEGVEPDSLEIARIALALNLDEVYVESLVSRK